MTLSECDEFAPKLGEPDGWNVAARFAAAILPGIFRLEIRAFSFGWRLRADRIWRGL